MLDMATLSPPKWFLRRCGQNGSLGILFERLSPLGERFQCIRFNRNKRKLCRNTQTRVAVIGSQPTKGKQPQSRADVIIGLDGLD